VLLSPDDRPLRLRSYALRPTLFSSDSCTSAEYASSRRRSPRRRSHVGIGADRNEQGAFVVTPHVFSPWSHMAQARREGPRPSATTQIAGLRGPGRWEIRQLCVLGCAAADLDPASMIVGGREAPDSISRSSRPCVPRRRYSASTAATRLAGSSSRDYFRYIAVTCFPSAPFCLPSRYLTAPSCAASRRGELALAPEIAGGAWRRSHSASTFVTGFVVVGVLSCAQSSSARSPSRCDVAAHRRVWIVGGAALVHR